MTEFDRVRAEVLPAQRMILSQEEVRRPEYDGFRALGEQAPFLCAEEWLPVEPRLLPLPGEVFAADAPLRIQFDPNPAARAGEILRAAQSILPPGAESYSDAIRLSLGEAAQQTLFNGTCYRLTALACDRPGRLQLRFGTCRYYDYLDTTEILAHEAAVGDGRVVRSAAGHWLFDLDRRHAGSGICALTLIRRPDSELQFLMMDRSRSDVHTGLGLIHVRPAGEFQPLSENPAQFADECHLWYALLRESAEEVGGIKLPRHFVSAEDFLAFDGIGSMIEAVRRGDWQAYYLGFGFDPLNYKGEFLLAQVIEARAFAALFPAFREDFAEGNGVIARFSPEKVNDLLTNPRLHPAAAACLFLATKHERFLRRTTSGTSQSPEARFTRQGGGS